MSRRAVHVTVSGVVQGVGYRAWVGREAQARALSGWVRNRSDGSVEAVFAGDDGPVEQMLLACEHGPRMAEVEAVKVSETVEPEGHGFRVLPTA